MSRVLKVQGMTDAPAVRPLYTPWQPAAEAPAEPPAPAVDPELLRLREEHERLLAQVARQAADMTDLRKQAEAAFREGEAKGREAGLREAADDGARRLAKLESGIEWAIQTFTQSLSALERLAPEVARQAVTAMLGQSAERGAWVASMALRQLERIESHAVIQVEVSTTDFVDEAALAALAEALGGTRIQAYSGLKSGDCRIRLKLGTLDIGVDQQWGRLSAVLTDMSEPGGKSA